MTGRATFRCNSVENHGQSKKINLAPVYEGQLGENEENRRFTVATPSGALWMTIDNPNASIRFEPGKSYYLDFTEAGAA